VVILNTDSSDTHPKGDEGILFENILFENILLKFVFEEYESVSISKCNIGVISHLQSKIETAKPNTHFLKKPFCVCVCDLSTVTVKTLKNTCDVTTLWCHTFM
jgi:hypothetical protein